MRYELNYRNSLQQPKQNLNAKIPPKFWEISLCTERNFCFPFSAFFAHNNVVKIFFFENWKKKYAEKWKNAIAVLLRANIHSYFIFKMRFFSKFFWKSRYARSFLANRSQKFSDYEVKTEVNKTAMIVAIGILHLKFNN